MGERGTTGLRPVLGRDRVAAAWWGVVLAAAGAVVALAVAGTLGLEDLAGAELGFWLFAGLVVFWDLRPIITSGGYDPDGVNLATAFVFAALLRWGIGPALVILTLGTLAGEVARHKPGFVTMFNVAQYALSYVAAWAVVAAVGIDGTLAAPSSVAARDVGWVLLAAAVYHVVNIVLVSLLTAPRNGRTYRSEMLDEIGYYTITTAVVLAVSPLLVVLADVEPWLVLLLLPPLLAVHRTAQMSVRQEHLSQHDVLTGLANRDRLGREVQEALAGRGGRTPVASLLLLDLDRFKHVNDTLGHAAGDALLVQVADRLREDMRDGDLVARLGGDEFCVLLTDTGSDEAVGVAQRLRERLAHPFELPQMRVDVDASIGVASAPQDGSSLEDLLRCADVAMYGAKGSGGGVEVYDVARDPNTRLRLGLLAELRQGVGRGELVLHYQPKVAFADGAVVGVEALVRWQHPTRGMLLPGEFVELASHSGLMREVTDEVVRLALAQAAAWRDDGLEVPVAVNITPRDLADLRFAGLLADGLAAHRLDPGVLQLEVTEHTLMDALGVASRVAVLAELGVTLSLDDFGTGYSSLTHLRRLPVTELKIDRSFVGEVHVNDAIIRSIVQLAHNLGLATVAEGVETLADWDALRALGCDVAQGYLVAAALPPDEVTALLRTSEVRPRGVADRRAGEPA